MNQSCPLPSFGSDQITLGHGSGGKLTANLLDSGVFSIFDSPYLQERDDTATCPLGNESVVITTDSFVVNPLFFPGGDIGKLAVHGTVNDLAMGGGIPNYLTLALILEEDFPIAKLHTILQSIHEACGESGVEIVTGDTKVVEKGKGDQIFINTTGVGTPSPHAQLGNAYIQKGDAIITSGRVGDHGATILAQREGLEISGDLASDTRPLNHIVHGMLEKFGHAIHFLRDPTRGGISSTLNEAATTTKLGIHIVKDDIPILPEVKDFSSILGLDPLYIANEGIFIAFVEATQAEAIIEHLRQHPFGKNAAIIGTVIEDHPGVVVLENEIGGRRPLNLLPGEQLPRIC
ncbi:MAG: hydrogenase expression/formation protein HypE [Verrucomicrobiales bacterium]|nr:hydrogenase expression/formation protein HypE [Verrucomicrobiales bacterium]